GLLRPTCSRGEQLIEGEADVVDVAAVLTQRPDRGRGRGDVELPGTEVVQGPSPVECFRYAGGLNEVAFAAQVRDGVRELFGQFGGHLGQAAADDGDLAFESGMIDPVVEAAALERAVQLPGAVGGHDDDGRHLS